MLLNIFLLSSLFLFLVSLPFKAVALLFLLLLVLFLNSLMKGYFEFNDQQDKQLHIFDLSYEDGKNGLIENIKLFKIKSFMSGFFCSAKMDTCLSSYVFYIESIEVK